MSCVSMSLATYHERLGRTVPDPGTVNAWLTSHHGYEDTDLIVWNAIAPLGKLHMESDVPHLTTTEIRKAVDRCKPVIANVRDGTHWVLITGYDTADSDLFYVNDPGFEEKSYAYSGMSNFVTYSNHSTAAAAEAFASYQKQRASLKAAKQVAAAPASPLDGVYGVDVSQPTSSSDFTCMKDKHAVSFVVIRSFTELGSPDPAVVDTARDARAAGVDVSVYHFPDTSQSASSVRTVPSHDCMLTAGLTGWHVCASCSKSAPTSITSATTAWTSTTCGSTLSALTGEATPRGTRFSSESWLRKPRRWVSALASTRASRSGVPSPATPRICTTTRCGGPPTTTSPTSTGSVPSAVGTPHSCTSTRATSTCAAREWM